MNRSLTLSKLLNLTILDLSNNRIEGIPESMPPTLKILNLSNNRIKSVGMNALKGVSSVINLSNNEIEKLPNCGNVRDLLDISNNRISDLTLCLKGNDKLQILNAANNLLDSEFVRGNRKKKGVISKGVVIPKNLKKLILYRNSLITEVDLLGLNIMCPLLETINLSFCSIEDVFFI